MRPAAASWMRRGASGGVLADDVRCVFSVDLLASPAWSAMPDNELAAYTWPSRLALALGE